METEVQNVSGNVSLLETTPFVIESSFFLATFSQNLPVPGATVPGQRNSHADFSNV